MPSTTRTRTGPARAFAKVFAAAVMAAVGWLAHLCTRLAPHAYRQLPNMVCALLLSAALLTLFAALPRRES